MNQQMTMSKPMQAFKSNVDSWIKDINGKVEKMSSIGFQLKENLENTNHNYELIYELRDDIEELKQEVKAIKILQMLSLSDKFPDDFKTLADTK